MKCLRGSPEPIVCSWRWLLLQQLYGGLGSRHPGLPRLALRLGVAYGKRGAASGPRDQLDLDQLARECETRRDEDSARHDRAPAVRFRPDGTRHGEGRIHVRHIYDFLDYVVQRGAVLHEHLPGVRVALGHLDAHVAVVEDSTLRIDRRRADDVALIVVAQLPGYPDGVADPNGLSVPVRLLPRHPESHCLFWDWHTASFPVVGSTDSASKPTLVNRRPVHDVGAGAPTHAGQHIH